MCCMCTPYMYAIWGVCVCVTPCVVCVVCFTMCGVCCVCMVFLCLVFVWCMYVVCMCGACVRFGSMRMYPCVCACIHVCSYGRMCIACIYFAGALYGMCMRSYAYDAYPPPCPCLPLVPTTTPTKERRRRRRWREDFEDGIFEDNEQGNTRQSFVALVLYVCIWYAVYGMVFGYYYYYY